ncbi:hypothetical protein CBC_A1647 [Clostridium botulinum C str. Eklund]|nr:hypothetical protein CBC_A1647 [Clostridium botulinum C str. Eklund]
MDRTELFDSIAKSCVDTAIKNELRDFGFFETRLQGGEFWTLTCSINRAKEIVKRFKEYDK